MTLAFIVYFGLMVTLAACWARPAWLATAAPWATARAGTQAALLSIIIFTVVIGGRYDVGGDFFGYIDYYRYASLDDRASDVAYEPGFLLLIQLLKTFHLPDRSIIVASSCIQVTLLSLWLRKHPQISPFVLFSVVALLLLDIDNIVRQGIAFFAILLALSELNERKWIKFFLSALFGYMFHRSAIIILPISAVMLFARVPSVAIQMTILALSYALTNLFFDRVIGIFVYLSPIFGYSSYSDINRADLAFAKSTADSFQIAAYLWPILDGLIIIYSKVVSERYRAMGYGYYHLFFLVAAFLQPVANSWDFLPFSRALFYFVAMRAVCIGFMLHYCLAEGRATRDLVVGFGTSFVLMAWLAVAVARGAAWSAPYQFF
ncbi:hypothetical protein J2Y58_003093 [Sphingomonas sp. BE138]|uniref:EpsG family protein n=1 Tax=Sphingomonas sp. BE138 TaxID=2817845 RepID=UPI002862D827|nr:EpsG family protein [Sphingomonas sp. BE138]MDR6789718.1 hypothetical protein [Sphingomonas sp. BE138]